MVKLNKQKIVDKYAGTIINYLLIPLKHFKNKKFINPVIIIYKLDGIGDAILSLPMIKYLKESIDYRIVVACSTNNKVIFQGHKFIDKIVVFNTNKFNLKDLIRNIKELRNENAATTIDTSQSSNISAIISFLTGWYGVGFKKTKGKSRNHVYNCSIKLDTTKHMVLNYMKLIERIGLNIPKNIKLVKLPCFKTDYTNSIIIHPCTIIPQKVWSQDKWAKVIKYLLAANHKLIIIGSNEEAPLVKELLKKVKKNNILNLSGKVKLGELISIINQSRLFVGIDGGPAHIAAAMNIPVISLFGYETPIRYAPFNQKSISIYKNLPCSPCIKAYNNEWPKCINPICMTKISVDDVIKAIEKLT